MRMLGFVGIVAGVIVAGLVTLLLEWANIQVFPLPADLDPADTEALTAWVEDASPLMFVGVLVAWFLGALAGGWTAVRIGDTGSRVQEISVGVILTALAVLNMLMIPHPHWMWVIGLLLFVPTAMLGGRVARGTSPPGEVEREGALG